MIKQLSRTVLTYEYLDAVRAFEKCPRNKQAHLDTPFDNKRAYLISFLIRSEIKTSGQSFVFLLRSPYSYPVGLVSETSLELYSLILYDSHANRCSDSRSPKHRIHCILLEAQLFIFDVIYYSVLLCYRY